MLFFLFLYLCVIVSNGLVLKTHKGHIIKATDLGPFHQHHHINKYFSNTLYPITNSLLSRSISHNGASLNPIINPVDYGADPTGVLDSTFAFQSALQEALKRGAPNVSLSNGIHDCGGATIDLGGGDYLISSTLTIPPYYGNIRITDGTIRANNNFTNSQSEYMIRIGSDTEECTTSQKSCNEYINIDHFFCDCKQICYGCIHINHGMSSNIGPQTFYLGYNGAGITTTGGHSLFLLNSWFGEYLYSDPRKGNYKDSTATSINLNNPDNLINDVIVYSSRVGVNITGPASVLINVHTWNLATGKGGMGIVLSSHARLTNCYLDYNDLVLYTPIALVSIQNTFFLGSGTLRLVTRNNNGVINSLSVVDSQYNNGNGSIDTIVLDETNSKFKTIENVYIKDTLISSGYNHKSTRVSKTLKQTMTTQWKFDFEKELLFTNIDIKWIDYTFQFNNVDNTDKESITHFLNQPTGTNVIISTNKATNATVYITVDQSINFEY